jgi:hypothetical protein
LGAVRVTTPNGTDWTVRRRWVPVEVSDRIGHRWRRRPKADGLGDSLELLDAGADIPIVGVVAAGIGVVVFLVVLVIWFPPLILIGFEIVLFVVLFIGGVFARFVLRRPWRVEARSGAERRHWFVQGFRAAGRHRDEIARRLRHGQNPLGEATASVAS